MALDTRLIGQAIGGGRPLDLAGAVRPAIARGEKAIAISQARAEARKAAYDKAIKEREAFSARLIGQFKMPNFKGVPAQGMTWLTEQAGVIKNVVYSIATDKNLSPIQQQILINEQKEKISNLEYWANEYKESMVDFVDKTDMLSQVNTEKDLLLDKMRIEGDYIIKEDTAFFNINNEIIEKPVSQLSKGFSLIEQDHIAYNDLLNKVATTAKKTAAQGKDKTALDYEITEGINNLKLTDMQYLTIAVDQLGYTGDFDMKTIKDEAKDENPDKIDNQELRKEIILFVENNIRESANKAFAAYFEPKDPKGITAADEKEKQTQQNINFATDQLNKMKLPKTSKGMIDVDSTIFNRLLNNLNLSVDPAGSYEAGEKKIITIKSNITNKPLSITSDMSTAEVNRTLLMLSGATPEEAMRRYPDQSGPIEESEVINIGSLPVKK
jgi:hypothetical protein